MPPTTTALPPSLPRPDFVMQAPHARIELFLALAPTSHERAVAVFFDICGLNRGSWE